VRSGEVEETKAASPRIVEISPSRSNFPAFLSLTTIEATLLHCNAIRTTEENSEGKAKRRK
jgi:hypothetical protein